LSAAAQFRRNEESRQEALRRLLDGIRRGSEIQQE
jgi:hypothetical protein